MSESSSTPSSRPSGRPGSRNPVAMVARVFGWLIGGLLTVAFAGLCVLGIALAMAYPNLPSVNSMIDYRPKLPMRIYSADGVLLGEFGEERRSYLPIGQIPKVMQNAVLAIEDSRFYEHSGVDYVGVLRAGLENLREVRSQGASTITMQLARNFYLSTEKTFTRKIYEILLALKIERLLSKEKILEVYMNQIYLGQRAYGFAAASEIYFGKPLDQITPAEAAMLAGLPKAPSAYNPIVNPKRAETRQRHIIDRMLETRFITQEQHDEALAQKLVYRDTSTAAPRVHAEYVAEMVRQMVYAQYGEDTYTRGLNITLSIQTTEQETAYQALRKGLLDFERRKAYRGPEAYVSLPADDDRKLDARVAEALEEHPDYGDLRSAVVLRADARSIKVMLQNGETFNLTGESVRMAANALRSSGSEPPQIRRGAVLRLLKSPKGDWAVMHRPEVEGAFVALDPVTGEVRALVGGFDFTRNKFNHVTQAWRQPGSSFKPFIYSAALEKGLGPTTVVNDAPLFFDAGSTGSQPWEPKNYDGQFDGPMSLRRGLAKSKNMVSIRVLQSIGPTYAQGWISRFGFEAERHPPYLTMALGAGSVTPMQMASAYAVFANGGYRINPSLISRIADARGRVIAQSQPPQLSDDMRAIPARNAFVMDTLLQEVTRSGTAAKAQSSLKRPDLYGKTGTTNDSMDAWFAGFSQKLVGVVWIGYDQPHKLGDKETGGGLALPVWIDFMSKALRSVPVKEYTAPEGVINVGGDWYYEENTHGAGIGSLGMEDNAPQAPSTEERKGILDLFRN